MTTADSSMVVGELDPIQKRIGESETDSIEARWEFGRVLLPHRVGKQLPKGLRAEIKEQFGLEASEITRRMQLAERFADIDKVVDACTRCGGSWRRLIREELPKNPRQPKATAWEERAKAKLDGLVEEAGKSDEHHDALVALLQAALSTLSADAEGVPA
jgi:hypothetical protein